MTEFFAKRITIVWLGLIGATLLSWSLGHGQFDDPRVVRAAIVAVAFIKVRFVMMEFMELRHAPFFMRLIADVWAAFMCVTVIALSTGAI